MTLLARALVIIAVAALPSAEQRRRYGEEWRADVDHARRLGLRPLHVALGATRAALHLTADGHDARYRQVLAAGGLVVLLVAGAVTLSATQGDPAVAGALALAGIFVPAAVLATGRLKPTESRADMNAPNQGEDMTTKIRPIGPLALGMRLLHRDDGQPPVARAIALAAVFASTLAVGIGILLATG